MCSPCVFDVCSSPLFDVFLNPIPPSFTRVECDAQQYTCKNGTPSNATDDNNEKPVVGFLSVMRDDIEALLKNILCLRERVGRHGNSGWR